MTNNWSLVRRAIVWAGVPSSHRNRLGVANHTRPVAVSGWVRVLKVRVWTKSACQVCRFAWAASQAFKMALVSAASVDPQSVKRRNAWHLYPALALALDPKSEDRNPRIERNPNLRDPKSDPARIGGQHSFLHSAKRGFGIRFSAFFRISEIRFSEITFSRPPGSRARSRSRSRAGSRAGSRR